MTRLDDLQDFPIEIREDLVRGIDILKSGGCKEIYLFGSVAEGRSGPSSDIDFAVRGCPASRFFKLQGRLLVELTRSSDLIDLDADPALAAFLEHEAALVHVG